jgi:hypothetical protein
MMPAISPGEIPPPPVRGLELGDAGGRVSELVVLLPVVADVVEPLDVGASGESEVRSKTPSVTPVVHV